MTPDAAFCLDTPYCDPGATGSTLFFFKGTRFFCWDVASERMLGGYPRDIGAHWPGLLESSPGRGIRGAFHVPAWGPWIYFLFEGQPRVIVWDMAARGVADARVHWSELLPSRLTRGEFTPLFARLAGHEEVIYGFSGHEYTRWSIRPSAPLTEDDGFPRRIDADWKDGLVLAPRAGVYVDWPNRSPAHSNRKIYFFMGDLYLRWDVPSHTRNYRLDIATGWKGWPVASLSA
jgi:hypothetical protein